MDRRFSTWVTECSCAETLTKEPELAQGEPILGLVTRRNYLNLEIKISLIVILHASNNIKGMRVIDTYSNIRPIDFGFKPFDFQGGSSKGRGWRKLIKKWNDIKPSRNLWRGYHASKLFQIIRRQTCQLIQKPQKGVDFHFKKILCVQESQERLAFICDLDRLPI